MTWLCNVDTPFVVNFFPFIGHLQQMSSATTQRPSSLSPVKHIATHSGKPLATSSLPLIQGDADVFRMPTEDTNSSSLEQQVRIQTIVMWLLVSLFLLTAAVIVISLVTGFVIRVGMREPSSHKKPTSTASMDDLSNKRYVLHAPYEYSPFLDGRACTKMSDVFTA